ncbi:UDP-N-acetylmuramoyl-tripeptide--D-alanyl-D-alanine ligase [Candidatus Parcubacteria bacterium]|nr:MAG: UDP-N-acetylmuramoyl-tripeptide--D-alanyl-D-alanine ligase [Candidatus Parcubacteria bacterium]
MRRLLELILASLARATVRRRRPYVIAVTGSAGKTSTKEAIWAVLKPHFRVRKSEKSFNTEIGVPLTILGMQHQGKNAFAWAGAIAGAAWRLWFAKEYPDVLVLEYGIQKRGDMDFLIGLARPNIGIVTTIGDIPVHVEYFANAEELRREKLKLIQVLPENGTAILNRDDETVASGEDKTHAEVVTYGFAPGADIRITHYELRASGVGEAMRLDGIWFKLRAGSDTVAVRLANTFGKHQAYAAAAAAAVGRALDLSFEEIADGLLAYEAPPGRLKLIPAHRSAWILDDTYNASPISTLAALDVLAEFPAKRRIAVLGDMLELGRFTEMAHRTIGEEVAEVCDYFIAVGERMKFAMDEAMQPGPENRRRMVRAQMQWFSNSQSAGKELERVLRPGDAVLVKGSQGMRMERVTEEVMAEPEKARRLLVRQDGDWKKRR